MDKEEKKLVFKIIKSENLKSVYFYILEHNNFVQKDLKKETLIKNESHVSNAIKFFRENNLIKCKNKEDANYKIYEATPKIFKIKEEVEKYKKVNKS